MRLRAYPRLRHGKEQKMSTYIAKKNIYIAFKYISVKLLYTHYGEVLTSKKILLY